MPTWKAVDEVSEAGEAPSRLAPEVRPLAGVTLRLAAWRSSVLVSLFVTATALDASPLNLESLLTAGPVRMW